MPGQGYNSTLAVAPELVAYGTKSVSTWHIMDYVRESIKMEKANKRRKSLRTGTIAGCETSFYKGKKVCGGDVEVEFNFQGMLQFLKHACGGYNFGVDTPVAGANTHTFTIAEALPSYGLSMEIGRANLPASKVYLYTGGKVNNLTFDFKTDEIMALIAGMSFKDEATDATPSITTGYATDYPVLWRYSGDLLLCGEAAVPFDGGSIKIDNALSLDRYLMSETLRPPIRADYKQITGEIIGEYDSLNLYTKYLAQTPGAFVLKFTSDSLITGTTYRSIEFSIPSIILDGGTPNVDGPGIVPYTIPFRSKYNGTDNPMTITVVSAEATLL